MADTIQLEGVRVLLVEDNRAYSELLCELLGMDGAEVVPADDAETAIELLEKYPFDAVVSDIKLPGISGMALLNHVRSDLGPVPVILITGYSSVDTAVKALKLGAQDYLVKPIADTQRLSVSIRRAVDHHRLTIENLELQKQIRQREETFRSLFNNANDGILLSPISATGTVGTFTEVNEVACQRLGYRYEDLLGMSLLDITEESRRDEVSLALNSLLSRDYVTFETVHMSKDGRAIPVEINAHGFAWKDERAILSIARDISARRDLEKRITEASEAVQRNIGREVHDKVSQSLTSITMLTSMLLKNKKLGNREERKDIRMINDLTAEVLDFTKHLCAGLFPVVLEDIGLDAALTQLADDQALLSRVSCTFVTDGTVEVDDQLKSLHLFRIAQEAVANAVKHSRAANISIRLTRGKSGGGVLTVEDDGEGLPENPDSTGGMGLHIMRYRANIIRARLLISENDGKGCRVSCEWQ